MPLSGASFKLLISGLWLYDAVSPDGNSIAFGMASILKEVDLKVSGLGRKFTFLSRFLDKLIKPLSLLDRRGQVSLIKEDTREK